MIVHLFPKSGVVSTVIPFINKYFDSEEHLFVLFTNAPFDVPQEIMDYSNVRDYDRLSRWWLYKTLRSADRIFMHNLSVDIKELLMISHCPRIMKKTTWVIWGGDLYWHRVPNKSLPDRYVDYLRGRVIRTVNAIAGLTEGDYQLAQEWYHSKATGIRVNYCDENFIDIMNRIKSAGAGEAHERLAVMVGNSATKTNHHIAILEKLARFSDEPMDVYCPISYGDMEYAGEIEEVGKKLFGDHFIPIKEYMNGEDYYAFLNRMDIGIFNNDRQQAIGNITGLAYLGKKLYLRSDTSMWIEWQEKEGYHLSPVSELDHISFEQFRSYPEEDRQTNMRCAGIHFDVEERIKDWRHAFEMPSRYDKKN